MPTADLSRSNITWQSVAAPPRKMITSQIAPLAAHCRLIAFIDPMISICIRGGGTEGRNRGDLDSQQFLDWLLRDTPPRCRPRSTQGSEILDARTISA
ncbi:hypothetical protein CA85_43280 [Allorhodopirellula solitaria]|uniref:Uncharacterized protein n=1 Tax=Allorhodopirellula solitaria TaxID=2527987 RepID=A0A5C5X2C9_9BACT|nr:hypothetical protein CA85_43280 [Allorhodopirellula solitaria]